MATNCSRESIGESAAVGRQDGGAAMRRRGVGVAVAVAVAALALRRLWDTAPIDPALYALPPLPELPRPGSAAGAYALDGAEPWFAGRVPGPEHIEFACTGGDVGGCVAYAGLADGRIVRFDPDAGPDGPLTVLNRTSSLLHASPDALGRCGEPAYGHLCGRPLGLTVTPDGTQLIIADAYLGILALELATNALSVVATEFTGVRVCACRHRPLPACMHARPCVDVWHKLSARAQNGRRR